MFRQITTSVADFHRSTRTSHYSRWESRTLHFQKTIQWAYTSVEPLIAGRLRDDRFWIYSRTTPTSVKLRRGKERDAPPGYATRRYVARARDWTQGIPTVGPRTKSRVRPHSVSFASVRLRSTWFSRDHAAATPRSLPRVRNHPHLSPPPRELNPCKRQLR